jgi:anti-anti-sigma regulatory factor
MAVSSQLSRDGRTITIYVQGAFDSPIHKSFHDAYHQYPPDLHYIVDLNQVSRFDSSALGMLLLLRDHAGGDEAQITLRGCPKEAREILNVSQFERLFEIE